MNKKAANRSVRRTKKLLKDNLILLLKDKTIDHITVKELTDLCDLNRGTFYLYYQDIYDMLDKIEDEIILEIEKILINRNRIKPLDVLDPLFEYLYENKELYGIFLGPTGDIEFIDKLLDIVKTYCFDIWRTSFKVTNNESYEYYYSYMAYGFIGVIRKWSFENFQSSPHEMALFVDRMILEGVHCLD